MGYKVPKRDILGKTGLVGYGIGSMKLPKIQMGSLLGKVTRKTSRKKYKGKKTTKRRR